MADTQVDSVANSTTAQLNTACGTSGKAGSMCGKEESLDSDTTQYVNMVTKLQRDNRLLRAQLTEVIEANKKWAAYDKKRDELVNSLVTKNHDLELRLDQTSSDQSPTANTPSIESTYLEGLTITQWRTRAMEEESLRAHLETVNQCQQVLIQKLQHIPHSKASSRLEDREQIELLKNQVQVFSEDFQQERKDRERAQAKILGLEDEMQLLTQQLAQFQNSHMAYLAERRRTTMDRYHEEYNRQVTLQQQQNPQYSSTSYNQTRSSPTHSRLIAHGYVVCDAPEDDDDEDVLDVPLACGVGSISSSPVTSQAPRQIMKPQSNLQCPKCNMLFPFDDTLAFLDHNDQCSA